MAAPPHSADEEQRLVQLHTGLEPQDRPVLKGRKRLVAGLKRIGSSQSLLRLPNRSREQDYRGVGRGSISCITLHASSEPYNGTTGGSGNSSRQWVQPHGSPSAAGFTTAPTSMPGTPQISLGRAARDSDNNDGNDSERPRPVGPGTASSATHLSTSSYFALPSDKRSAARSRASTGVSLLEPPASVTRLADTTATTTATSTITTTAAAATRPRPRRPDFDFWRDLPVELSVKILQLLEPRQVVRCSAVSRRWHAMCFDGQLWARLDASDLYRDITADALQAIMQRAGPFVRQLNLRGCVQLADRWRPAGLAHACTNLESMSLEGCRIDRQSSLDLLRANAGLVHLNLAGMVSVTNRTMKVLAQSCPGLEMLNVSWCTNMDTYGLRKVVEACPGLRDVRAGELRGFDDRDFMLDLFRRNSLERLMLQHCDSLTDDALAVLLEGVDAEVDHLTGRRLVPPRTLRHLDLARCRGLTDAGVLALAHLCPDMEGLRVAKISALTDASLTAVLPTMPKLSHLDLEELDSLTNRTLQELARAPCMATLKHLSISYCENLGDSGMLPVVKAGRSLRSLELDNTRISNLVLIEAAAMVRQREPPARSASIDAATAGLLGRGVDACTTRSRPKVGLRMVVYDCQNVTWTGIREILSRNAEIRRPRPFAGGSSPALMQHPKPSASASSSDDALAGGSQHLSYPNRGMPPLPQQQHRSSQANRLDDDVDDDNDDDSQGPLSNGGGPAYPHHVIALKVFYGYQPTVLEHTRRVLRGDLAAAARLERKWAEYMMASEEAGAPGGFGIGGFGAAAFGLGGLANRRRRRRAHQAMMMHADEEDGGMGGLNAAGGAAGAIGRRRRARSGGSCTVM